MNTSTGTIAMTLAVGLLGTLLAAPASASCTFTAVENATAAAWMRQQAIAGGALQHRVLATAPAAGARGARTADDASYASIVGLWKFTFVSKGTSGIPDGTVLDAGYATWHGDGTELMNSSRPPKSGDFCMGVYKQTGRSSYALNHVTLAWDPTGSFFVGPGSIHELVTVDGSGTAYSGTFTIDQYAQDGTTVLAHLAGTVSATRIPAD